MKKRKTILIGIDGASWNFIDPLLEKDRLPNIYKMIKGGRRGILNSTIPPFSPVAWSTFITGKNPDKHGIFDWCKCDRKTGKLSPVVSRNRRGFSFWHYLNKAGLRTGIFNLPLTFPAEKVDGFFISGFDSPDDSQLKFYPQELQKKIRSDYDWDIKLIPFSADDTDIDPMKYVSFYENYCSKQTDSSLRLIKEYEIDVFVINFSIIDHFNHKIKDYSMIEKGLEIVDRNIGKYINEYQDANFIIFSDHGSTRIEGCLAIVEWLNDNGYIEIPIRNRELTKFNTIMKKISKENIKLSGNVEKILRHLLIKLFEFFPTTVLSLINEYLSKGRKPIRYWPQSAINTRRSKIMYCSTGSNGIYLNNKEETVDKELDIERFIQDLLDIRDPIYGRAIIERVYKKEELYQGTEFQKVAPDLILKLTGPYSIWIMDSVQGTRIKNHFFSNNDVNYFGRHINEGIFIFYGKDFKSLDVMEELNIVDIPAITLFINGVSIPKDFDGKVKKEIFSKIFFEAHDIKYQEEIKADQIDLEINSQSEELEEITKKLSDLGYM